MTMRSSPSSSRPHSTPIPARPRCVRFRSSECRPPSLPDGITAISPGFAAVFLLNVKRLEEADWNALTRYVHEGGGLVVAPGHLSQPENYNQPTASQLLPGQLENLPHTAKPPTNMTNVTNLTHPLFERYGKDLATVLAQLPVYKYWPIRGAGDAGLVLVRFADGAPALLERNFKGPKVGKVLLWTMPLSRRADHGGALAGSAAAWSEFPLTDPYGWSFLALMDRTVPYLSGAASETAQFRVRRKRALAAGPDRPAVELRDQRRGPEDQAAAFAQRRIPGGARAAGTRSLDRAGDHGRQPHGDAGLQRQHAKGREPVRPPGEEPIST